jgi:hypothetical protein
METDPVSETSCFSSNYLESGRWTNSENPVILCVIHHRQNPIESTRSQLLDSSFKLQKIKYEPISFTVWEIA